MRKRVRAERIPSGLSRPICTLSKLELNAYHVWCNQRRREGVKYGVNEFIARYCQEYKKRKWRRAHVGRKDHDAPYSFSNVEMQEQAENNRERNQRRGNPSKSHRPVIAVDRTGKVLRKFKSKTEAAKFYGVDTKSIYNKCNRATADFPRLGGPRSILREITFRWA
jgi:hypothetical protein